MSEPTGSQYPTAYDDASTLLGAKGNRKKAKVAAAIDINDLIMVFDRSLASINLPAYAIFEGGEAIYIESGQISGTTINLASMDQRAVLGTRLQPHGVNEWIYFGLVAQDQILLNDALVHSEQHHGLIGNDASKPSSPDPGMRYVALDTGHFYYCFSASTWTRVEWVDHGDLDGKGDDDHTQYHNDSRANTWHSGLGTAHIASGDDHDHYSSNEGAAVLRFAGGVHASRPSTPTEDGEVYFSTDLEGGTLFVGLSGSWIKVSGVPAGGIMAFNGDCPSPGWTRYTDLDEKIPMGSATAGATGGAATHKHVMSQMAQHYHPVTARDGVFTDSTGGHTHHCHLHEAPGEAGGDWRVNGPVDAGIDTSATDPAAHTHGGTMPAHYTDYTGTASPETATQDSRPASRQVVWCKKG